MKCPPLKSEGNSSGFFQKLTKELYTFFHRDLVILVSTFVALFFKSFLAIPLAIIFASGLATRIVIRVVLPSLECDVVDELKLIIPKSQTAYYLSIGGVILPVLLCVIVYKIAIIAAVGIGIYSGLTALYDADKYAQTLNRIKQQHSHEIFF